MTGVQTCALPISTHLANGRLADIAPTALALMGLARPPEMTGRCLLIDAGEKTSTVAMPAPDMGRA